MQICHIILLYLDSWLGSQVISSCADRSKRGVIDGNLHAWPSIWTIWTDAYLHSGNLLIFCLSRAKRNENVWYRAVVGVNLLLQMCPQPTTQRSTHLIHYRLREATVEQSRCSNEILPNSHSTPASPRLVGTILDADKWEGNLSEIFERG